MFYHVMACGWQAELNEDVITELLRLRNDLYCVEWGVKLYSLTHSLTITELHAMKDRRCQTKEKRQYNKQTSYMYY